MVQQGMKKKEESGIAEVINRILADVDRARNKGFSPEAVKDYYNAGLEARENREMPKVIATTPKRQMEKLDVVVQKREEKREPPEARLMGVDPRMTKDAIISAVGLAEKLEESASQGKPLNLKKWISG
jgi:hypothetical protein